MDLGKEKVPVSSPMMEDHSKTENKVQLILLQMSSCQRVLYDVLREIHQNRPICLSLLPVSC